MNYQKRVEQLQNILKNNGCDLFLVDDLTNLFYLTSCSLSAGVLLVHAQGAILMVDNRYYENCKKQSPFPVLLSEKTSWLAVIQSLKEIKTIGFDSETTSYKRFCDLEKEIRKNQLPYQLIPLENPIRHLRTFKDSEEIALLHEAAKLGSNGYDYILTLLKEGITEKEIALELEIFWKKKGSKALAFDPIIAFGKNSSMPHYRAGDTKLTKGMIVLIDIGVNLGHYHSDMTRTLFYGTPHPKLEEIYQIVLTAQQKALSLCKPGVTVGELDQAARQYIEEKDYGECFSHSLGHGVGLEIHELPVIRNKPPFKETPLMEGMVITIEPGIYLPELGGVRIEDTVVITKDGYLNLTERSKDLSVID